MEEIVNRLGIMDSMLKQTDNYSTIENIVPLDNHILKMITEILIDAENLPNDNILKFLLHPSFDLIHFLVWRLFYRWYKQRDHKLSDVETNYLKQAIVFNMKLVVLVDEQAATTDVERLTNLLLNKNYFQLLFSILNKVNKSDRLHFDSGLLIIGQWIELISHFEHEHPKHSNSECLMLLNTKIKELMFGSWYQTYIEDMIKYTGSSFIWKSGYEFFIGTCSFSMSNHIRNVNDFDAKPVLEHFYSLYYSSFITVYSKYVNQWSNEIVHCLMGIISFITHCCLNIKSTEVLKNDKQVFHSLFSIVTEKKLHESIISTWTNNETILIDLIAVLFCICCDDTDILRFFTHDIPLIAQRVYPLTEVKYDRTRLTAYLLLAYVSTEDDLLKLKMNDTTIQIYFRLLEAAFHSPTRSFRSVPIEIFLKGLLAFSIHDVVQVEIAKSNKVPLLIEIAKFHPLAYDILWTLSFHVLIQQQLETNKEFIDTLINVRETADGQANIKAASGILWNLNYTFENTSSPAVKNDMNVSRTNFLSIKNLTILSNQLNLDKTTTANLIDKTGPTSPNQSNGFHFDMMISYSHDNTDICHRIYDTLIGNGYTVWVDFNYMRGNVMEAMAEAIESTDCLLLLICDNYKRSNYCRAEALYAYSRQVTLIPLLMQKKYKADGWLGLMLSQLIYIDFTKYEFNLAFDKLKAELFSMNKKPRAHFSSAQKLPSPPPEKKITESIVPSSFVTVNNSTQQTPVVLSSHNSDYLKKPINQWLASDINHWCQEKHLNTFLNVLQHYDGYALIKLYELSKLNYMSMINVLQTDCKKLHYDLSVFEYIRFLSEFEKLSFTHHSEAKIDNELENSKAE
ncbi:unnamed protein product [Didymodactylos carnosus]|uniref:TIR domain-containing protein n=1 Tax=Didymodactylos carnosus TaxID=1234261 RepID=A0A814PS40_9BILA|nr:unnamed protein product [Didymodactylos carnosus]CAF1109769.1 unnamed protein product [Didymodactylos carnosus]CAF3549132.1 unnamed protein product [Didymodactylos carnosus]CAF3874283.1 unnamed protein product [Didymodactylos carnosus]